MTNPLKTKYHFFSDFPSPNCSCLVIFKTESTISPSLYALGNGETPVMMLTDDLGAVLFSQPKQGCCKDARGGSQEMI